MDNFMKIRLLHAVLHDGHRVEAGQTGNIEETLAEKLIASGAAVAVEDPPAASASDGSAMLKEPVPLIQPDTGQPAANSAAAVDDKTTGTKAVEADPKPAKAKEGK